VRLDWPASADYSPPAERRGPRASRLRPRSPIYLFSVVSMPLVTPGIAKTTAIAATGGSDFPRRNVFMWAAVILVSNHLLAVARGVWPASLGELVAGLFAVGIFQCLAWYAVFHLIRASHPIKAARRRDVVIVAALCLLVFFPASPMIWVAATGVAIYLLFCGRGDLGLRAAGMVLAALSVQELWGHILFQVIAPPLLRAETAVVGAMLQLIRGGTVWHDNIIMTSNGYGIVLFPYCSSFHNVSLALLCWVTLTRLRYPIWRGYDFVVGGLVAGTLIILNTTRLYLMALDIDAYHFWHEGAGSEIFQVGASVAALLLTLYGSRAVKRQT